MKSIYSILFIGVSSLFLSCTDKSSVNDVLQQAKSNEYYAQMASYNVTSTRTVLSGLDVCWAEDDAVAIFAGSKAKMVYTPKKGYTGETTTTLVESEGSTFASTESFSSQNSSENIESVEYMGDSSQQIETSVAYYPANMIGDIQQNDGNSYNLYVRIPSVQTYVQNSFGRNNLPMVAVAKNHTSKDFLFKNVFGLLKTTITGRGIVKKISIKDNTSQYLCGNAIINCSYVSEPQVELTDETNKVCVLNCGVGVSLDEGPIAFYFALPPMIMEKGLVYEIETTVGTFRYNMTGRLIIERSRITSRSLDLSDLKSSDELVMELSNIPKYKCLHHDNFNRENAIGEIGVNSEKNDVLPYGVLSKGTYDFNLGINNKKLVNEVNEGTNSVKIVTVNAGCTDYSATVARSLDNQNDVNLAFRIIDINNFYYARLTPTQLQVYKVKEGTKSMINSISALSNCKTLKVRLEGGKAILYVNGSVVYSLDTDFLSSTTCGLYFSSEIESMVDDFFVEVDDVFVDTGFDEFVENGIIDASYLGIIESPFQPYSLNLESNIVNNSNKSLRFDLKYSDYTDFRKYRVEVCPKRRNTKALDSWIFSFDVLIPSSYVSDYQSPASENVDFICQLHDAGPGINPPFCITVIGTELWCTVRGHSSRKPANRDVVKHLFKIADVDYDAWMNIVIYLKEGYEEEHSPKTIVYVNGEKKLESSLINSYNSTNYLKFGQYKPIWGAKQTTVDERVVYFDNIHYLN